MATSIQHSIETVLFDNFANDFRNWTFFKKLLPISTHIQISKIMDTKLCDFEKIIFAFLNSRGFFSATL